MGESHLTDMELLGLFHSIGMQQNELAIAEFSEELKGMGSDELSAINSFSRQAFLERNPGLVAALNANVERIRALYRLGEEQALEIQRRMSSVPYDSPEMTAIQAEYGAVILGLSLISDVVEIE